MMMRFLKKIFIAAVAFCALLVLLILFHVPVLQFIGCRLVYEDKIENVPVLFVLSGDPWDRGNEAVKLFKKGLAAKIICTGENVPRLFLIANIQYPESELTQMNIISQGVPANNVMLLSRGTSTKEESDYIIEYCRQHNIKKLGVISTKFHTRRIQNTFAKKIKEEKITRTAIVIISDVIDPETYEYSKLYDKEFSHGYRKAKKTIN